jgi:hypothetical protein
VDSAGLARLSRSVGDLLPHGGKNQLSLAKVALITNAADELITAFPGRP